MADTVRDAHQEFWRPPLNQPAASDMAESCGRCGTEIPAAIVQEAGEDRDLGRALRELREKAKALSQRFQAMQAKAELPPARSQPKPDPNG